MTAEAEDRSPADGRLEVTFAENLDQYLVITANDSRDDPRLAYAPLLGFSILSSVPGFVLLLRHEQWTLVLTLALLLLAWVLGLLLYSFITRQQIASALAVLKIEVTVGISREGFDLRQGEFWGKASWGKVLLLESTAESIQFYQGSVEWVAPRLETLVVPRQAFPSAKAFKEFSDRALQFWSDWQKSGAEPNMGDSSHWPAEIAGLRAGELKEYEFRHAENRAGRLDSLGDAPTLLPTVIAMAAMFGGMTAYFLVTGLRSPLSDDDTAISYLFSAGRIACVIASTFVALYHLWRMTLSSTQAMANPVVRFVLAPSGLLIWHDWEVNFVPAKSLYPLTFVEKYLVMKSHAGRVRHVLPWRELWQGSEMQKFIDDYSEVNLQAVVAAAKGDRPASENPYQPPQYD